MLNDTELAIVAALIGEALYGTALIDRVADISGGRVRLTLGGVYPTLHRMERKNLIEGFWGDKSETRGGARRRYYRVTGLGEQAFAETRQMVLSVKPTAKSRRAPAVGKLKDAHA